MRRILSLLGGNTESGPVKSGSTSSGAREQVGPDGENRLRVLKKGPAMRVIFFYPGEEGTYVDNAEVTLYENGVVQIRSSQEETTTHLQNCEILWRFEVDAEERTNKVRLLKPKGEVSPHKAKGEPVASGEATSPEKSGSPGTQEEPLNPDLR